MVRTDLAEVEVYHLDAPTSVAAELSARLPQDLEIAARLAGGALPDALGRGLDRSRAEQYYAF